MITPTVMPPVTPKQKIINIFLYTTKSVIIVVLMNYLPIPYGIRTI